MKHTEQDMEDEAERMQSDLEQLGEHADAAAKKAQVTREQADVGADEPPGDEESRTASS